MSVIIVTHNRKDKLSCLLKSVFKSEYQPMEVVVVDDCSSDGTDVMIKREFPAATFIRNNQELELSACRNLGAKLSHGSYLFLIDDDNIIESKTIRNMVRTLNLRSSIAVLGPLAYYACNPEIIWGAGTKRGRFSQFSKFIGHNQAKGTWQNNSLIECDDFSNAFMVSRKAFEGVGGFDALAFSSHLGEADFCARIRRNNFGKIVLDPTALVWHDIPIMAANQAFLRYLPRSVVAYEWERNRIILQRRCASLIDFACFMLLFEPVYLGIFLALTLSIDCSFAKKAKVISRMFRGVRDAIVSDNKFCESVY